MLLLVATGTVSRQENLPRQSAWIHRAAENQAAAHVDCVTLVKSRCDGRVLGVASSECTKNCCLNPRRR